MKSGIVSSRKALRLPKLSASEEPVRLPAAAPASVELTTCGALGTLMKLPADDESMHAMWYACHMIQDKMPCEECIRIHACSIYACWMACACQLAKLKCLHAGSYAITEL